MNPLDEKCGTCGHRAGAHASPGKRACLAPGVCDCQRYISAASSIHPIVIIESPFAGDLERNARYLDACLLDSLRRGEAPFASHGLYTRPGVLRDSEPTERELGIQAGFAFRRVAARTVVYTDLGISDGMQRGIDDANENDCRIEYRKLEGEWK